MPHDPLKCLRDIRDAAASILQFTANRLRAEYAADEMLRAAVERKFEIIGEALNRLKQTDAVLAARIPEQRQIISFRNLLIHGYDIVDHKVVWDIIQGDLPVLVQQVEALLHPPPTSP
jgi:uncharacterized protein with HEPN domain